MAFDYSGQTTILDNGRFSVPSKIRDYIRNEYSSEKLILVQELANAPRYVNLYPEEEWQRYVKTLTKNNDAERHAYARALGNRVALEPDSNCRLIIPQHIREKIGLVGECQLIGFENYFSIWPMAAWNEFNSVPLDTGQLGPAYYDLFL